MKLLRKLIGRNVQTDFLDGLVSHYVLDDGNLGLVERFDGSEHYGHHPQRGVGVIPRTELV